ncbi:MAG: endolytic transglycosylase MltG [Myxococcota bacterium]
MALIFAAVGFVAWLLVLYPKQPGPGEGQRVDIHIAKGASLGEVAGALGREGALASPRLFAVYARLVGADERLRQGPVVLTDDLAPAGVLPHIARGFGSAWVRLTVPEGFNRFEVARRLAEWDVTDADAFLRVTGSADVVDRFGLAGETLEGYLFPATYRLAKETPPLEVARDMVGTWRRRVMPLVEENPGGLARLKEDFGWGLHEVLTLASIVEKEAAASEERPVIAGVFLNRLRDPDFQPKRLQADPTVAYGCVVDPSVESCAEFDGGISRTMLRGSDNRYNTYRAEGLPPGPIANPGTASIRAVLAPATHDYLYFVARGAGRHRFSVSLEEHAEAVGSRDEAAP